MKILNRLTDDTAVGLDEDFREKLPDIVLVDSIMIRRAGLSIASTKFWIRTISSSVPTAMKPPRSSVDDILSKLTVSRSVFS